MIDHLRNSMSVHLDELAVLILDEADRLLELGFSAEIRELVYFSTTFLFSGKSMLIHFLSELWACKEHIPGMWHLDDNHLCKDVRVWISMGSSRKKIKFHLWRSYIMLFFSWEKEARDCSKQVFHFKFGWIVTVIWFVYCFQFCSLTNHSRKQKSIWKFLCIIEYWTLKSIFSTDSVTFLIHCYLWREFAALLLCASPVILIFSHNYKVH